MTSAAHFAVGLAQRDWASRFRELVQRHEYVTQASRQSRGSSVGRAQARDTGSRRSSPTGIDHERGLGPPETNGMGGRTFVNVLYPAAGVPRMWLSGLPDRVEAQVAEVLVELSGALATVRGPHLEGAANAARQHVGYVGRGVTNIDVVAAGDGCSEERPVGILGRPHPGQEAIEGDAYRIHVRANVAGSSFDHFRRADERIATVGNATVGIHDGSRAKVADGRPLCPSKKDVAGLDVAMDEAVLVTDAQTGQRLARPGHNEIGTNAAKAVVTQPIFGGSACGQLGCEVRDVMLDPDVTDPEDPIAFERLEPTRFHDHRGGIRRISEEFQGDNDVQIAVVRRPHFARAASPQEIPALVARRERDGVHRG
jgi:hypothetical protein